MVIQLQVLNKVLQDKNISIITSNNLNLEFFSNYKDEYSYIINHYNEYGNVPDIYSFLSAFPNFDNIEVNEPTSYLIDKLYEDRNTRALAKVFNEVRSLLNEDKINEATSVYLKAVDSIVTAQHLDCVDILSDQSRYEKYIERCDNVNKYYVTTGFSELDNLVGGWDRQEELVTIVARPNVGKSWILFKCALAAAQAGLNVGIYSGEMSEYKVGYRIDTLLSHISNGSIIHGNRDVQLDYKTHLDTIKDKVKGSIKVLTPSMINGPAGVTALRSFIEKEHLDMLCIDQHSLLEDDNKAKNPIEKASNISKDLKNLQVLKKIPILAVSQQNRTNTDNGVDSSHVAQSDRISQDSTILIFLERKDNKILFNLVKARDSENNKILSYNCDFNKGLFEYIPTEDEAQEYVNKLGRDYPECEYEDNEGTPFE